MQDTDYWLFAIKTVSNGYGNFVIGTVVRLFTFKPTNWAARALVSEVRLSRSASAPLRVSTSPPLQRQWQPTWILSSGNSGAGKHTTLLNIISQGGRHKHKQIALAKGRTDRTVHNILDCMLAKQKPVCEMSTNDQVLCILHLLERAPAQHHDLRVNKEPWHHSGHDCHYITTGARLPV